MIFIFRTIDLIALPQRDGPIPKGNGVSVIKFAHFLKIFQMTTNNTFKRIGNLSKNKLIHTNMFLYQNIDVTLTMNHFNLFICLRRQEKDLARSKFVVPVMKGCRTVTMPANRSAKTVARTATAQRPMSVSAKRDTLKTAEALVFPCVH